MEYSEYKRFSVGDRVRFTDSVNDKYFTIRKYAQGTVTEIDDRYGTVAVTLDEHVAGLEPEADERANTFYVTESDCIGVEILATIQKVATKYTYTLDELEAMPTISQGQADDLKIDSDGERVWLSRLTTADGADVDHEVTHEKYNIDRGRWEESHTYAAKSASDRRSIMLGRAVLFNMADVFGSNYVDRVERLQHGAATEEDISEIETLAADIIADIMHAMESISGSGDAVHARAAQYYAEEQVGA